MRHLRLRRRRGDLGDPERVGRTLTRDGRAHRPPRPRRQRHATSTARCAHGHAPPVDHRPRRRPAADRQRGRPRAGSSSTARSTTTASCAQRLLRARPPLRHRQRHRGARPPLRGARRRRSSTRSRACSPSPSGIAARQALLLARDRLGIKPLYYAESTPRGLVFGSELKSLLCHPDVRRARLAGGALALPLVRHHAARSSRSSTACASCRPATCCAIARGERRRVRRYWDLRAGADAPGRRARSRRARCARSCATRSASHLVADVPVGAFLSGGVDSAAVVGTMAELGARPKTFSHRLRRGRVRRARLRARRSPSSFGTDHHELVVRPDAWALTEKLVWLLDEPFADVSAMPTYLVSKLAAAHVKVVLSGDGGDEVFGGYDRYAWTLARGAPLRLAARAARARCWRVAAALPDRAPRQALPAPRRAAGAPALRRRRVAVPAADEGAPRRPASWRAAATRDRDARRSTPSAPRSSTARPATLLGRLLYLDTMTYLPLDILTKVDRMTMAHSLEARPPLLDHTLVERVFALPSSLKLRGRRHAEARSSSARSPICCRRDPDARPSAASACPSSQWLRGAAARAGAGAARRSAHASSAAGSTPAP